MGLTEAIRKTIKYAGKYGCELTWREIKERLIGNEVYQISDVRCQFKRNNDNKYWKGKMEIARDFTEKYLSKIDDILMVGVTGSVASKYPKESDDIDLMVVTRKDSLWLTRFKIYLYFWTYKIPHKTNKDNICINLWLEDLTVPHTKQNLKNAVDLILMRPILDRQNTYKRFLSKNNWVKRYVANPYDKKNS